MIITISGKIVVDSSHPGHYLFENTPLWQEAAGHQDQNRWSCWNSFFPSAVSLINRAH